MTPEICPNCGADVPPRAKACPECGACENTGWSEEADSGHLGLPEDSFDYQEYVQREFGPKQKLPQGIGWFWGAISLVLAALLFWFLFRGH